MFRFTLLAVLLLGSAQLFAQPEPVADFIFQPDYTLPGRAANQPGPRTPLVLPRFDFLDEWTEEMVFLDQRPTERLPRFWPAENLPEAPFTVELWLLHHVNQPVGLSLAERDRATGQPNWVVGYYGREFLMARRTPADSMAFSLSSLYRGWKNWWLHVTVTFGPDELVFYFNGELTARLPAPPKQRQGTAYVELAGYFANEPYMEIANLLKRYRVYEEVLTPAQIAETFTDMQDYANRGLLYPDLFHFNAGPYLHFVTPTSINLSWEADRPVRSARLYYGQELPLTEYRQVTPDQDPELEESNIYTYTLDGLQPATPYFYELELISHTGDTIRSGELTFATAPDRNVPFGFAVLGDTEARPHINFRTAELIWDERPAFLLNLGDLTDGGKEPRKFEWNQEYFQGMTPLTSRVPVFPVPGNGESDLFWYNRYHLLPDLGDAYSFRYGDAEFFMLNSNERDEFAPGGRQYVWLEEKLQASTARWKFVAHHHAPYSSDEDDYGDSWSGPSDQGDLAVRQIVPLYERYGVDVVFFGHLHTFQRTLPIANGEVDLRNGVVYIQGGGGGGNLEDFAPTRAWFSGKTYRGHHYITVNVDSERLHLRMYDTEGRLRDFFEMEQKGE